MMIIAVIIVSILFVIFAFCEGYHLGQDEFIRDCKKHDFVVYTRENFEAIKNYERVQGYEQGYRDAKERIKRGLKEEDND